VANETETETMITAQTLPAAPAPHGSLLAVPATETLRPLLFLDIEASSFDPASWPVEIGYAWLTEDGIARRSAIIAPRPEWPLHAWSEAAADVHGISLRAARSGIDADVVAAQTDAFADFEVVSDNPRWDQMWLDRLRVDRPAIPVRPLRAAIRERLGAIEADAVALALFRGRAPHRAGPDALRLATAWAEGLWAGARRAAPAMRAA
jgi:hypothetical protein